MSTRVKCFLCGIKAREKGISLHAFPKDKSQCALWKQICDLREEDDVTKVKICGNHFKDEDFRNLEVLKCGGKVALKQFVVPSVAVLFPLKTHDPSHCHDRTPSANVENVTEIPSTIVEPPSNTHKEGEELQTPKKRKFFHPRYLNEIKTPDVATPKRAKKALYLAKEIANKRTLKIKALQQQNWRLRKKIKSIQDLVEHLKEKNLMSEEAGTALTDTMPENVGALIRRHLSGKRRMKFEPSLRSFALTLQFYSSKAYNYVRSVWKNLLPHPSTLRSWYTVIGGKPGFTEESFKAINLHKDKQYMINIVMDEMAIRQQIIYDFNMGHFYGGVDMGTDVEHSNETVPEAKNAFVFMAVALNGGWKVPLGYFLISSLTGKERANLLTMCFELLSQRTDVKVCSITFDGASVNLTMCHVLGADFTYGPRFKPWFSHPITLEQILIFFDPSHMIKLVRNALGDKKVIYKHENEAIDWNYIIKLEKLQSDEGLHAATKLRKKHINYSENRMNVKLAAQTLSESVSKALLFAKTLTIPDFQKCEATANFVQTFDSIFDMLNCRNKFAKHKAFNVPICADNKAFLENNAQKFIEYIAALKFGNNTSVLESIYTIQFILIVGLIL